MSNLLETSITAVTVYTDQALITRRGQITLTGEERELTIAALPLSMEPESVRVGGTGTVAVQLGSVRTELVVATEPVADRVAQLAEQIEQVELQQGALQNHLASIRLKQDFVEGLGKQSINQFSRALSRKDVGLDETRQLLEFLDQSHQDHGTAIAQLEQESKQLNKQLTALHEQLRRVQTPHPEKSYSLVVTIVPAGAGEFELELSYLVKRATWRPLYDLQVTATGDRLQLSYLAEVQQNTGEDWLDVALTLSTAKPGLGTLPPTLNPWYIDVASLRPAPAPPLMRSERNHQININLAGRGAALRGDFAELDAFGYSNMEFEMMMQEPQQPTLSAEVAMADMSTQGGVITFQVSGGGNIPNDGNPYTFTIFRDEYPCHLDYIAIPRLVSFAYLQAVVTNQQITLLPGKANLFRDNRFVGTTQLANVSPGQTFKLNLGIDESIQLERDLAEREVDKRLFGGKRRLTVAYRLVVTNLSDRPTTLTLTEQLPVSRNEQIKVRLAKTTPTIQPGELGRLDWQLTLPAHAKQEIYYQFMVEHSPELQVTGLAI